jgi:hypothetical protein
LIAVGDSRSYCLAKLISTTVKMLFYNRKTVVPQPWKCFSTTVKNENVA